MVRLYTAEDRDVILRKLHIKPKSGKITTQEAARILSWRAKEEFEIEHTYLPSAVRRRLQTKSLQAEKVNERKNLYDVEDIFDLEIKPKIGQKEQPLAQLKNSPAPEPRQTEHRIKPVKPVASLPEEEPLVSDGAQSHGLDIQTRGWEY